MSMSFRTDIADPARAYHDGELTGLDESEVHGLGATQQSRTSTEDDAEDEPNLDANLPLPDYHQIQLLLNAAMSANRRHHAVDPMATALFDPSTIRSTMAALQDLSRRCNSLSFNILLREDPTRALYAYQAHVLANDSGAHVINALNAENGQLQQDLRRLQDNRSELQAAAAQVQEDRLAAEVQLRHITDELTTTRRSLASARAELEQRDQRIHDLLEHTKVLDASLAETLAVTQQRDALYAILHDVDALIHPRVQAS
ncbi:hypothetical protein CALVIDRAFT_526069 [Calocera viscosa TUFC12733]|uniref:Uncharacterized protein n=1 Tax=Calocera viscosa (strain TUFC12733) TaxID=1330018 RepID=A0A167PCB3_CALVF|nr:hypothetical protein CALVIDRAFT_526069 [Calocera viscosa TUFC12733]